MKGAAASTVVLVVLVASMTFDAAAAARCVKSGDSIKCDRLKTTMDGREVLHQTPEGTPPADGWPVIILYHGWYLSPESTFKAEKSDKWGLYNKALTAKALLEKGYAIIAPHASTSNEGTLSF